MNEKELKITREALTRELEHHIEELCNVIIKDITTIQTSNNITLDNFEVMTHIAEALESVCDGTEQIIKFLLKIKITEKMMQPTKEISFDYE